MISMTIRRNRWARLTHHAVLSLALIGAAPAAGQTPAGPSQAGQAAIRPLPFEEAVVAAARKLFGSLPPPAAGRPVELVIDPLVDGATGVHTIAAGHMGQRIVALAAKEFPYITVSPFSQEALARAPLLLIGTITGINDAGQVSGRRDAYAIWLTAADLKTNEIVAKGTARSEFDGVDASPSPAYADSPVWREDAAVKGYVESCRQRKVGDKLAPAYVEQLPVSAVLADAEKAYAARSYRPALRLYQEALSMSGGRQLRVLNGLYMVQARTGRRADARKAFGDLVDHGLEAGSLAARLLFRPGTARFVRTREAGSYPMWLVEIARHANARQSCLEVVGHTSPTGPAALNEELSLMRAEYVRDRLDAAARGLAKRIIARGAGPRENLVGTGRDDASDALDRRVEFKVRACS